MIIPKYLKKGDKIAIVSPAGKITGDRLENARKVLEKWGLTVVFGRNVLNQHHQFAGTDEQRAADFQEMLDDHTIDAILCSRGGYGSVRIIERLDFSKFLKNPKWIIGFSDITLFHALLNQKYRIASVHGIMPKNFPKDIAENDAAESLKTALWGKKIHYKVPSSKWNRQGKCSGEIMGGNLAILYSLNSTPYEINPAGKILFIEDINEYLYQIDRMMNTFKMSGKLAGLAGLVVGGMTNLKDNDTPFGKIAQEIIQEAVAEFHYPVCFDFPAGHINGKNRALIFGKKADLKVDTDHTLLDFE